MQTQIFLADSDATEQFGAQFLAHLPPKALIFLRGDLGAGKTTFVRGLLRAAGVTGTIKSPTYALIEEYETPQRKIFHFDLYRLADPDELEWIGIDDYLNQDALCFIEWAEKGRGVLPQANFVISLSQKDNGRLLEVNNENNIATL